MRRFSIILSGAAFLMLAAAPVVAQAAQTISASNHKPPPGLAANPKAGTSTACAPKNARTATSKIGGKATPSAKDDCNTAMGDVLTTR